MVPSLSSEILDELLEIGTKFEQTLSRTDGADALAQ